MNASPDVQFKPTPLNQAVPGTMYTSFHKSREVISHYVLHFTPDVNGPIYPGLMKSFDWFMYLGHERWEGFGNKRFGWYIHVLTAMGPGYLCLKTAVADEFLHGLVVTS